MNVFSAARTRLASALVLALAAISLPALSQTAAGAADKAAAKAKATAQDRDMLKLSQDGFMAMRAVRAARIAIFNGNPQTARDALVSARTSLDAASKEAPVFIVDVKTGSNGKIVSDNKSVDRMDLIPIDGQVVLADSFVATPEKKSHIDKANEHFAKSRGKDATEELRLAEVDASFSRVLMPIEATSRHVGEASSLLAAQKFYEANLALKAAEDGLRMDSVMLSDAPPAKVVAKARK